MRRDVGCACCFGWFAVFLRLPGYSVLQVLVLESYWGLQEVSWACLRWAWVDGTGVWDCVHGLIPWLLITNSSRVCSHAEHWTTPLPCMPLRP